MMQCHAERLNIYICHSWHRDMVHLHPSRSEPHVVYITTSIVTQRTIIIIMARHSVQQGGQVVQHTLKRIEFCAALSLGPSSSTIYQY